MKIVIDFHDGKEYLACMKHKHDVIQAVGTKVYKPSGKPFKSGNTVNTVKGVITVK